MDISEYFTKKATMLTRKKEDDKLSMVDKIFAQDSMVGINNAIMCKKGFMDIIDFFDRLTLSEKMFLRGFLYTSGRKTFSAFNEALTQTHARARDNALRLKNIKGDPGKETWWLWLGYFAGKEM